MAVDGRRVLREGMKTVKESRYSLDNDRWKVVELLSNMQKMKKRRSTQTVGSSERRLMAGRSSRDIAEGSLGIAAVNDQ